MVHCTEKEMCFDPFQGFIKFVQTSKKGNTMSKEERFDPFQGFIKFVQISAELLNTIADLGFDPFQGFIKFVLLQNFPIDFIEFESYFLHTIGSRTLFCKCFALATPL